MRSPVEAGSIPYSALTQPRPRAAQPARQLSCDAGRADHARAADREQHRAVGRLDEAGQQVERAQLVRRAAVVSHPLEC